MSKRDKKKKRLSARQRADSHRAGGGENTVLAIPQGLEKITVKETTKALWSVIPFEVTRMNPVAMANGFEVGDLYFERTYWVHPNMGPEQRAYACPYHNTKHLKASKVQKCPICEHRLKLRNSDDEEDRQHADSIQLKERQLWLIFDHNDPKKGVQLFDASFHALGKHIDEAVREDEDGVYELFADPDDGLMLQIKFTESPAGGSGKWYPATRIDFKKRKDDIDDEVFNHGIDVDAIIKVLDYKELSEIFLQGGVPGGAPNEEEDEDDDDDEDAKPRKKNRKVDDDDEDDAEEEEQEDEDEDDRKSKKSKKSKRRPDPDDDDDEDDD